MSVQEFMGQLSNDQVTALVQIMALAAEADGEVSEPEAAELAKNIETVTNGGVSRAKAGTLLAAALARPTGAARDERLAAIKSLLPSEQRPHALLLAIKVTCADGVLRTSERELILELAEALEIPGEIAADLVKAVST